MSDNHLVLKLPRLLADELDQHILAGVPNEVCGLLGGNDHLVSRVVAIQNISPHPHVAFEMDPQQLIDGLHAFESEGLDLLAIYHSHPPGGPSSLSATDIELAYYPDSLYLLALPAVNGGSVTYQLYRISRENEVNAADLKII